MSGSEEEKQFFQDLSKAAGDSGPHCIDSQQFEERQGRTNSKTAFYQALQNSLGGEDSDARILAAAVWYYSLEHSTDDYASFSRALENATREVKRLQEDGAKDAQLTNSGEEGRAVESGPEEDFSGSLEPGPKSYSK
ncbi:Thyroglobulin [Cricetulus griseus]|uniref:Thyroglobulin n=1 Tax=Cricetulus griseus TaxID=10029 RepID=G3IML9_CRIGR|nr:Thyroglobulin [Cricetulus griseus]